MTRTVAEIDALLAAEKSLFGQPEWVEEGPIAKLASAVVDAGGAVIGGLSLRLSAQIETAVQRGNAALVLDGQPLQRLSFRPDHVHVNGARHPIPAPLRLMRLPADRSRIYRWTDNRVWPRADNMGAGVVIDPEPASVGAAIELFLEKCTISAYLPQPPHRPKLEL